MSQPVLQRSWVSPLTAISFVVVAVTGLLMLFHVRLPGVQGAHQWMGLVFALAGLFHLVLNWRQLLACCRSRSAVVALAAGLALLAVALALPSHDGKHGRGDHARQHQGRGPR